MHLIPLHRIVSYSLILILSVAILPKMLPAIVPSSLWTSAFAQSDISIDLLWHAPLKTPVSNLSCALDDTNCHTRGNGVYDFIFNSSFTTEAGANYGTYNWCNMPHVRPNEYRPLVSNDSGAIPKLRYVEVIHRHHKRTPYAANSFPIETQHWNCSNAQLYYYGAPVGKVYGIIGAPAPAQSYWSVFTSSINPFKDQGFLGNCEFPQITAEGLLDSWQHGRDLYGVYHDKLGLIPDEAMDMATRDLQGSYTDESPVSFRVTNNVITSEVAGMVINGMFSTATKTPLLVEEPTIDSLEPTYSCPTANALYASYGVGSNASIWTAHLDGSAALSATLDEISGVSSNATDWHVSWDHYFDNLSARLCHQKELPCNSRTGACVSAQQAAQVFRLGEWEYNYIYRAGGAVSLKASAASYGVWIAELASHLRKVRDGQAGNRVYRHNIAHDGSLSRLLSVLQIEEMVWPGMGAEVVFELYSRAEQGKQDWFVRILWGGKTLRSSSPMLGVAEMIALDTLLAYFDGLVGENANLVVEDCR